MPGLCRAFYFERSWKSANIYIRFRAGAGNLEVLVMISVKFCDISW
jgi:hypothetical protein